MVDCGRVSVVEERGSLVRLEQWSEECAERESVKW